MLRKYCYQGLILHPQPRIYLPVCFSCRKQLPSACFVCACRQETHNFRLTVLTKHKHGHPSPRPGTGRIMHYPRSSPSRSLHGYHMLTSPAESWQKQYINVPIYHHQPRPPRPFLPYTPSALPPLIRLHNIIFCQEGYAASYLMVPGLA